MQKIKTVLKQLSDPSSNTQTIALTLVAAVAYVVRAFPYFIKPQLYAEDGVLWLSEGVNKGVHAVRLQPYAGFFHFPERLFGFLVARLPLLWAPAIFAYTAWGLFILTVYFLLSKRTKILTKNYERFFVVASLCLLANFGEFYFNFSNSVFLMGIVGALILIADRPKNRVGDVAEKVFFVLTGLCLPFSWFYIPMVIYQKVKKKAGNNFYLYAAIITGLAQIVGYLSSHANRSPVTLFSVFSPYTLLILYNQIIIPAIRFARIDMPVASFAASFYPQLVVLTTCAAVGLATWLVLKKANKQLWLLLFFLAGMTFASIKSPSLSVPTALDALKTMAVLSGANRYFIYGIVGVNIILAKATYEIIVPRFRYWFMVFFFFFGLISSIHYLSFRVDKNWVDLTTQYKQGVQAHNHGQKWVIIPVNPQPWTMGILKQ